YGRCQQKSEKFLQASKRTWSLRAPEMDALDVILSHSCGCAAPATGETPVGRALPALPAERLHALQQPATLITIHGIPSWRILMKRPLSRRRFLASVPVAAAAVSIVPAHVLAGGPGTRPSEKLNIACIGLGWPGRKDTDALASTNNIVALCDVDESQSLDFRKKYSAARQFQDARKMLDEMGKGIDAVIVATPDHTHAVIAMDAMRRGKHVYCEKPLAHSIYE